MITAQFEPNKFHVFNWKDFEKNVPEEQKQEFIETLERLGALLPHKKFYVCNQDEPYAQKVLDTILEGESVSNG